MTRELRLVWSSLRKHWVIVTLTIVFSLGAAASEALSIGMLIPFLQTFSENADPLRTGIYWVDTYVLASDEAPLVRTYHICAAILLGTWLRSGLGYLGGLCAVVSRVRIIESLRRRIVDQLQSVSLQFFSKSRGGDLLNSITTEIGRTTTAVAVVFDVITQGTLLVMYVTLMTLISWQLTILTLAVFALLSLGLTLLMSRIHLSGEWLTDANSRFTASITEFIEAVRTVTAYNRQPYERERLYASISDLAAAMISISKRAFLIQPLSQAIVGTVIVVLIVVAVQFYVLPGVLDIAFLLGFLFALFRMMPAVNVLNDQRGLWASNRPGLARIVGLLETADKPYLSNGTVRATPLREAITFENVDFEYEPGQPVLKDLNFGIPAGSMVALVGGSGAGKSTLADLVPRFFDPTRGTVRMDGIDLRDFNVRSLRDQIGIVSQSTYIFNDTIRANIAYGNLDADEATIRRAADLANATGFIEQMEEGFDTILGDRGVRLSGGQRQRIAIARAIVKDPNLLILDEATSALDSISEKLVQRSLEFLMDGRTVLAIAHRLSTIENADWVIVLENGRIVEQGTYTDLIAAKGHLWSYHRVQFHNAVAV
jgi:subfamily B ATP-binding cassette protein MsbA